jgi:PAS domain S-box-containing protein
MYKDIVTAMINNATLLLTLSIVYEITYIFKLRRNTCLQVLNGVIIGLIGLAIMYFSRDLIPNLVFDTRTILLSVAALTFGFIPSSIAAIIMIAYRLTWGGVSMVPGITVMIVSVIMGIAFRKFINIKKPHLRWLKLYVFGIAVHVAMLLCLFMMPWESALNTIKTIGIPVLGIYPVCVVLLSLLLLRQSEHSRAARYISEADSRYRSLFYDNHAAMMVTDPESGQIVDANPAACAFYGWSESTLKSMNISDLNVLTPEELKAELDKAAAEKRNYFQLKHRTAKGQTVDVEVFSGPIKIGGKTLNYAFIHDNSERAAVLEALQESEQRFRLLVDNAPDAIFVMIEGKFAFMNKAGLTLLRADSPDDYIGISGLEVIHADYHESVHIAMTGLRDGTTSPSPNEIAYMRHDGTIVDVEATAVPIMISKIKSEIIFARDITEKKRLEESRQQIEAQLRQQQKLEAIGTLAGGVAHEINNPINGIMNYAQLIYDESDKSTETAEYSKEIIHETERISTIVKNLLQFSRHEKQSHSYASIYDIINQTLSLVNTIIKKDQIKLVIELDEGLPDIKCRSQQIQQVIMNLLTNARDALNERYPGYNENKIIRLSCSLFENDGRRWLRLTVLDNGCGIPEELKDRVFEPFFSTKPKEIGTGLGLSISYGIVNDHHGSISFESATGEYTKCILVLPVDNGWTL